MNWTREDVIKAYGHENELYPYYDYQTLIDSFGEVLLQVDDGDYQGDTRVILKSNHLQNYYGVLIFGWGSCSGCDALQACQGPDDVAELRNDLINEIHWEKSAKALLDYFNKHDWEGDYSWHADETKEFVVKGMKLLEEIDE